MTLLEADSETELNSKAGHYLKNDGIKVGFKIKWAVHSLYKVQTLSGVNWPNSHPVFAKPVPSPRLIEIFFMPKYRQRLLWIDHSLNKIFSILSSVIKVSLSGYLGQENLQTHLKQGLKF